MKIKSIGRNKKWQALIFALCWTAYAFAYFGRANLSIAIPSIQTAMSLSKTQLGFLGTVFFWVYGLGQLINGNIGDKVGTKQFIFIALIVAGTANILFGFAAGIAAMLVLWAANGYFQSMLWGPIVKTLAVWFPSEKRTKISIYISTSMVAGYWLAWGALGKTIEKSSWQSAFWIPGAVLIVFALLWLVFFKNVPEDAGLDLIHGNYPKKENTASPKYGLIQVIKKEKLWFIIIACMVQGIIKDGLSLWVPTILIETLSLDISSALSVIVMIPLMNFAGMLFAGWLNGKLGNTEKKTSLFLFAAAVISLGISLVFIKMGSIFAAVFIGITSAVMFGTNTLLLASLPMKYIKYNKTSSIAGLFDFSSYFAAGISSALTGLIVVKFDWAFMFFFWIMISCIGVFAVLLDIKKTEKTGKLRL